MKQYLELLQTIKDKGAYKAPAREGMPGTTSLFGYQFRHNLADGFPLLTTKKLSFKHIVTELIWFLRGDTNIKYLVDNGCNIWNEDAYNYYLKVCKNKGITRPIEFKSFVMAVKQEYDFSDQEPVDYKWGDCGKQYGWLWRNFGEIEDEYGNTYNSGIDQIEDLIEGLKNNPMSRRHIITAWNPATLDDMALNACHTFVQFNCRPVDKWYIGKVIQKDLNLDLRLSEVEAEYEKRNLPKYYLDCQMYQRSADVFLGVPYNIASYALLTEILAKTCNMVAGEYIHTFGDVHIYDNHQEQVDEQLKREESALPTLKIKDEGNDWSAIKNLNLDFLGTLDYTDFELENYNPQPSIKAKLSTGLK